MPPALTKKMFGLPRWAWLLILAAAIGIGLYLRHKKAEEERAEAETTGEEQPVPVGGVAVAGEEAAGVQGGGEYYPSAEGYYPSYGGPEYPPEPPESVVINVNSPTLPSATDDTPPPSTSGGDTGKSCKDHPKPKAKAGGKYECVSGKWQFVPSTHPGSGSGSGVVTGGGPPDKKHNKTPIGVGAATAVPTPHNAQHPVAVNTGNPCVNGGVGKHTPPSGYHLFCQGGTIWRAPNS